MEGKFVYMCDQQCCKAIFLIIKQRNFQLILLYNWYLRMEYTHMCQHRQYLNSKVQNESFKWQQQHLTIQLTTFLGDRHTILIIHVIYVIIMLRNKFNFNQKNLSVRV